MLPYRLAAIAISFTLISGAWTIVPEQRETIKLEEQPLQDNKTQFAFSPLDLEEIERVQNVIWMQKEILRLWILYLESQGHTPDSERLEELRKLAWMLATAIDKHQRIPMNYKWWIPEREGSTLPINSDTHLLLATMAGFESRIDPSLVGKLGEVGILQCHKWCRKGHPAKEVKNNPQLGIELAVAFFTESIDQCGIELDSLENQRIRDKEWSKPVALYGAGNSAIKNKRCESRQFARWRVNKMRKLREKIRD